MGVQSERHYPVAAMEALCHKHGLALDRAPCGVLHHHLRPRVYLLSVCCDVMLLEPSFLGTGPPAQHTLV